MKISKNSRQLARNAAQNSMRIAECLPGGALDPGAFPTALFEAVAQSGVEMAIAECREDFWAQAHVDWESCCQRVADRLMAMGPRKTEISAKEVRDIAYDRES